MFFCNRTSNLRSLPNPAQLIDQTPRVGGTGATCNQAMRQAPLAAKNIVMHHNRAR